LEAERGERIRLLDAIEGLIERQSRADAVLEGTKKRIEELRQAMMVLETKGRS
jgi:hypothetical protein